MYRFSANPVGGAMFARIPREIFVQFEAHKRKTAHRLIANQELYH
uniref:Uncharacterized protein n=1 Tax=Caenorhabditis japonica TaxID=281687 RepID=A0A8R1DNI9_CAEJA